MAERTIILYSALPEQNEWHRNHLSKTLDCQDCTYNVLAVDTQRSPVYSVCTIGSEWKLIRGNKPTRKCKLLKEGKRPEHPVFEKGIPEVREHQAFLPLRFSLDDTE
jgi:hypothetical protein